MTSVPPFAVTLRPMICFSGCFSFCTASMALSSKLPNSAYKSLGLMKESFSPSMMQLSSMPFPSQYSDLSVRMVFKVRFLVSMVES